jgi:hypothetical protein
MVDEQQLEALGSLYQQITASPMPSQPEGETDFDAWARLVLHEADLAGILSAGASGVRMDYVKLKEIRSAVSSLNMRLPELTAWKEMLLDIIEQIHRTRI